MSARTASAVPRPVRFVAGEGAAGWLRRIARSRWVVLTLVAVCARALTFGNPILQVDEEFYLVVAQDMLRGALPYVDVWDRKPIGLFLVYLPAGAFGPLWGVLVYQAMALAAVVATAVLIARLADRAGWARGSLAGAALYILWLDLADGQGGQAPVFYNLAMVGAAASIAAGLARGGAAERRHGLVAMALVGTAMQVKYAVVFEGVGFGLWLLWSEWRGRGGGALLAYGAALVAVALLPTLLAAGVYAALGQLPAFLYANFTSILARGSDPVRESLGNLATVSAMLAPLVAMAVAGARGEQALLLPRFLRAWLGAALLGLLVFGSWFNHYALPAMAPAACCAAAFLGRGRWGRRILIAALALGFVGGQIVLLAERRVRGTPARFARIVAAIPRGGTLYVYSGSTALYTRTGHAAPTPYLFPTHLMLERERGAIGIDQAGEIERILGMRPDTVVMQSYDGGERTDVRALVLRRLAAGGYRPAGRFPIGDKSLTVYRR